MLHRREEDRIKTDTLLSNKYITKITEVIYTLQEPISTLYTANSKEQRRAWIRKVEQSVQGTVTILVP